MNDKLREALAHIKNDLLDIYEGLAMPAPMLAKRSLEWVEEALAESPIQQSGGVVTEDTSDGYHSFKELYRFRKAFNACLFNEWAAQKKFDVHKSKRHNDGELCFGGGWFIVVATLPGGQISNHYELSEWDLFKIPEFGTAKYEFDGHTSTDVVERLESLPAPIQQSGGVVQGDVTVGPVGLKRISETIMRAAKLFVEMGYITESAEPDVIHILTERIGYELSYTPAPTVQGEARGMDLSGVKRYKVPASFVTGDLGSIVEVVLVSDLAHLQQAPQGVGEKP